MKRILLTVAALVVALGAFAQPQLRKDNIEEIIKAMTLQEKATLLVGGARAAVEQRLIKDFLQLNISLNARRVNEEYGNDGSFGTAMTINPTFPIYNEDGSVNEDASRRVVFHFSIGSTAAAE